MRWPWTSVARLDDQRTLYEERLAASESRANDLRAQIDWLQDQNARLTDQITRIQRHQAGMYEVPKPDRPKIDPIPRELLEYTNGFASESLRKHQRDTLFRRHARGESWQDIMAEVFDVDDDAHEEGAN